jgi:hypothetical protein
MSDSSTSSEPRSVTLTLDLGPEITEHIRVKLHISDVLNMVAGLVTEVIGRTPTSVAYVPEGSDIGFINCDFDGAEHLPLPFTVQFDYAIVVEAIAEKFITHPHIQQQGFRQCGSWISTDGDGSIELCPLSRNIEKATSPRPEEPLEPSLRPDQ